MTQDVTGTGEAIHQSKRGPIAQVREGMKVFDAAGEDIGKVDMVKMGDPGATTTEGQEFGGPGRLSRAFADAITARTEVPPQLAAHLMRIGFIHVDGKGWIDTDRYVAADKIESVSGNTVQLNVTKDRLIES